MGEVLPQENSPAYVIVRSTLLLVLETVSHSVVQAILELDMYVTGLELLITLPWPPKC